ncbi:hypothetical protein FA13DRAFT_1791472 [Coprinellus micaceus]|uniref:Uncharacterized protein n=1 Tax=Coprinellus micaceus TaxID=71717 RepID=A0A4Y7TDV7_COPMI|nr:hypothetical protein FA13DRAFT_1791472 [Coprinellus micaceus]
MAIDYPEAAFVGTFLEYGFLGAYAIVFGLYVQNLRKSKASLRVVDYGLVTLFMLCLVTVILDSCQQFQTIFHGEASWTGKANAVTSTFSITLDFISQVILIYRCWIVWGSRVWVIALPALLAVTSWVTGLCVTIDLASSMNSWRQVVHEWILYVYRASRGVSHQSAKRASWAASVFLESAIALFFAQLVYLVLYKIGHPAFALVAGPVTVIYGLNCTAIMVRVGMDHSYETTLHRGSDAALRDVEDGASGPSFEGKRSDEKLHFPV